MGAELKQSVVKVESRLKKKLEAPHAFVVLFIVIVLTAIATYFIPAGEYDRTTNEQGQSVIVDGSYHAVDARPSSIMDVFNSIYAGMSQGAGIIFFIFIVGGAFQIFKKTQAIEAVFGSLSKRIHGKEIFLIPVLMVFFSITGAAVGMFEEVLPFIMILIPIMLKMGFDSMTGTAVVLVGISSGFTAAFMNPFTIGVAQGIAELPLFSGMGVRIIFWLVFLGASIAYVMFYAKKVWNNPTRSITYEEDKSRNLNVEGDDQESLSRTQVITLIILAATIGALAFGVINYGWFMKEIAATFLIMAVLVGIVNKMGANKIASTFAKGCEELVVGALVVGFAYGVLVLLQDSTTLDTILYYATNVLSGLPSALAALGMYGVQGMLNFIVTSGSGQAALSMPIMVPLSDLVEVNRQTAVLAFQMGDGISNIFSPTSGLLLAALAMARISWWKWFKWVLPLILIHYILGGVFVTIAHLFIWT